MGHKHLKYVNSNDKTRNKATCFVDGVSFAKLVKESSKSPLKGKLIEVDLGNGYGKFIQQKQ